MIPAPWTIKPGLSPIFTRAWQDGPTWVYRAGRGKWALTTPRDIRLVRGPDLAFREAMAPLLHRAQIMVELYQSRLGLAKKWHQPRARGQAIRRLREAQTTLSTLKFEARALEAWVKEGMP